MLNTFAEWIGEFALIPGSGGQFELTVDGSTAYSKKETGRYPELSELKDALRQAIDRLDAGEAASAGKG